MNTQDWPENLGALARASAGAVTILFVAQLSACTANSGVARSSARIEMTSTLEEPVGPSGSSSELVFSGNLVQRSSGFVPSDWTDLALRSDQRLGAVQPVGETSRLAYPEPEAPDLGRLRFILLQPLPDRTTYFRRDSRPHW